MIDQYSGKQSLLKQLSNELQFPSYFGNNWDALDECLRDLSWLPQRNVYLIHKTLPSLPEKQLKVYLSVLATATHFWLEHPEHEFWVAFAESDKETVSSLLRNI